MGVCASAPVKAEVQVKGAAGKDGKQPGGKQKGQNNAAGDGKADDMDFNGGPADDGGGGATHSGQSKERSVLKAMVEIRDTYEFGNVLGKGQFGVTRLVKHKVTGAFVKAVCHGLEWCAVCCC
jgi:hypothetical protein